MNTLKWTVRATRQLRKIKDVIIQKRIYRETQTLRDFPNCTGVKRLTTHDYTHRLRVGN